MQLEHFDAFGTFWCFGLYVLCFWNTL